MIEQQIPIGELLEKFGYINKEQINIALNVQKANRMLLGEVLQKLNFVTPTVIAQVIAQQYGFEYIELTNKYISKEALSIIPFETANTRLVLPIEIENNELIVAMEQVNDMDTIDYIKRLSPYPIKLVVAEKNKIQNKIRIQYSQLDNPIEKQIETIIDQIINEEEIKIVQLVSLILDNAIKDQASDIHITPDEDAIYIFFRIDGLLQLNYTIPKVAMNQIISRIKILSKMDISEQRIPQDGSFSHKFIGDKFDLRVSTIPTDLGENIVMRILSSNISSFSLQNLGIEEYESIKLKKAFNKPHGIVLVTGPTGSGKTTTLYSLLKHTNFTHKNIITIEDPIEYRLTFIRQTEVNHKAGYTFDTAIKHFMRQDPDVILVGEIRDEETAKLAVRAAITGHLVLSTLHTNDSVSTIPRLLDLGIKNYLISSSVLAIIAQRLVRKLCVACKEKVEITKNELIKYGANIQSLDKSSNSFIIFKECGCSLCNNTGFKGREAVVEMLMISDKIKDMITEGKSTLDIIKVAKEEGMQTLKENALLKVLEGKTSLVEVERVVL